MANLDYDLKEYVYKLTKTSVKELMNKGGRKFITDGMDLFHKVEHDDNVKNSIPEYYFTAMDNFNKIINNKDTVPKSVDEALRKMKECFNEVLLVESFQSQVSRYYITDAEMERLQKRANDGYKVTIDEDGMRSKDITSGLAEDVDNMLELLNSGDRKLRGSSKAYKEIRNELKELKSVLENKTFSNLGFHERYVQVLLKGIGEKANKYVNDRKNVLMDYSAGEYKRNRVDIMSRISAMTGARAWTYDEITLEKTNSASKHNLKNALVDDFGKRPFNVTSLIEILNIAKAEKHGYPDDNQKMHDEQNKISESRILSVVAERYDGQCVSFNETMKTLNQVNNYLKNVKSVVASGDTEKINAMIKKIQKDNDDNLDMDKFQSIYEKEEFDYKGKITGDRRLDDSMREMAIEILEKGPEIKKEKGNVETAGMQAGM